MTVAEAIRAAAARLERVGPETARIDAERLMAHALDRSRSAMLIGSMRDCAPPAFEALVERRLAHEPLAYIIGEAEFWGRAFAVSPDVLIPRGDTETLVRLALEERRANARVLDLGTGSGALLVTVLAERADWQGLAVDRSRSALAIAQANAARHGVAGRAEWRCLDWTKAGWNAGLGRFDLILCNPPYVDPDATLDRDVSEYEPHEALFAQDAGLADYRSLIPQLAGLMAPDALALFEIGHDQADRVAELARQAGLVSTLHRDLAGRPRCLGLRQKADIARHEERGLAKDKRGATS